MPDRAGRFGVESGLDCGDSRVGIGIGVWMGSGSASASELRLEEASGDGVCRKRGLKSTSSSSSSSSSGLVFGCWEDAIAIWEGCAFGCDGDCILEGTGRRLREVRYLGRMEFRWIAIWKILRFVSLSPPPFSVSSGLRSKTRQMRNNNGGGCDRAVKG